MDILVVNIDSTIPNLAIHKIVIYHKKKGHRVRQISDDLSYSLLKKSYDKVYVSCVFSWNKGLCKKWEGIADIGGSGYSLSKELPPEIDAMKPKINLGFATRGCIRNCIDGDTPVNTVLGMIKIKDLVGKRIGVWTYEPKTGEAFISEANKVWYVGEKECVRITFDDDTSLVCTPDHRFLTFKNGNQYYPVREEIKEAKNLNVKDRVVALKRYEDAKYGVQIHWRRKNALEHRIVTEYSIGRKLTGGEVVHHKDKNRYNNLPNNLVLCANKSEHFLDYHSEEMSSRMVKQNPMKNSETIRKVVKTRAKLYPKGTFHRTYEQRIHYRNSKLGKLNPNYKDGKTCGRSHLSEINHKVTSIEYIGRRKVYDLSVPQTGWFFVNNVLVHNCYFCVVPKKEGKIREVGDVYDIWDGKAKDIILLDNNILALPKTFFKICKQLKKEGLGVDFNQGLDHRLLTDKICQQLFSLRYGGRSGGKIRFAFDDIAYESSVLKALKMLRKHGMKDWNTRWYVYVGVKDTVETVLRRVNIIRDWKQAAFVMRDRDERVQKNEDFTKIYSWSTNIWAFASITFPEFNQDYAVYNRLKSRKDYLLPD